VVLSVVPCAAETYEMLKFVFGEETTCRSQTLYWVSKFKCGSTTVSDGGHSGHAHTSKTD
jgi:hypothetical protein